MIMLNFSADMKYRVFKNGTATVTETRTVRNTDEKKVSFPVYQEVLPASVDINSIKCFLIHGDEKRSVHPYIEQCAGTDRKLLKIYGNGQSQIECPHGITQLETEYQILSFYSTNEVEKNCYMFWFHHSLPSLKYLEGMLVNKHITVIIDKPANRFLWKWSILSINAPASGAMEYLKTFAPEIRLEFVFDIGQTQHYYNAIVLIKHLRKFPLKEVISFVKGLLINKGT
jgi:hypothetical protein